MDVTALNAAKLSSEDFSVYFFISVHNKSQRCETPPSGLSSLNASSPVASPLYKSCHVLLHLHDHSNNDKT